MLDLYQLKIVNCQKDLLVIAGPGSGKTTTITYKVKKILQTNSFQDILLISFTNKSVEDLQKKINDNIKIMTFHKLAIDILKYNNIPFKICNSYMLNYLIDEYLITLNSTDKNKLLRYLNLKSLNKSSPSYLSLKKLIITFISLFKTNNNDFSKLQNLIKCYKDKFLIKIIFDIFLLYEKEKQSQNLFDFDDLIIKATQLLHKNYNYLKYKYIIIDEFQDTSIIRLNLIKVIYDNSNAVITAVGDDCQSIFHFTGCNLNIFLNFQKYFPNAKIYYLKNTYRYSQNIINISEKFINKNPYQLKHNMQSKIKEKTDFKIIYYFHEKKVLEKILEKINSNDILILYRNKKDLLKYLNKKISCDENYLYFKKKQIKHLTIHSAKGLEANYVIILSLENGLLGFPNKLEDHKIINYVKNSLDNYLYSEERRIFFVAITRSKKCTFLLVPFTNPSKFIKEIKRIL